MNQLIDRSALYYLYTEHLFVQGDSPPVDQNHPSRHVSTVQKVTIIAGQVSVVGQAVDQLACDAVFLEAVLWSQADEQRSLLLRVRAADTNKNGLCGRGLIGSRR